MAILWCCSGIVIVRVKSSSTSIEYVQNLFNINSTYKYIDQFSIGYMVNHKIHVNKVFREQVDKCLGETFHEINMTDIRNFL